MDSNTIREQVKTELQTRGWTLHLKQRRARIYAYAARRIGTRTEDRYLAPFDDLLAMLACVAALPNGHLKDARLVPEASVESAPVCRALYDGPIMDRTPQARLRLAPMTRLETTGAPIVPCSVR